MERWFRSRWFWFGLVIALILVGGVLFLRSSVINVMHPALDRLSSISLSERWSHPEMIKIRNLGTKAVPPLRRVLREKDAPTTRFLLWVKRKWPGATKYFSHFPDADKLTERRWTACQVLQTLGPAGRSAAPEVIKVLRSNDQRDVNAGVTALWAIGIDADICDQLDAALEEGTPPSGRFQMISALARVRPPSTRTLKVLSVALADSFPNVQSRAAETLGQLGVATPEVVATLRQLQSTTADDLVVVASSAALWELEKDANVVLGPVFRVLTNLLRQPLVPIPGGGSGGQGITGGDQCFMAAGDLFRKMQLGEPEKSKALALLDAWCNKTDRIFVRMLLLPPMLDLRLSQEKGVAVCKEGLEQEEIYYRIQAARLLEMVSKKSIPDGIDLDALIRDREVAVRVYAATILWRRDRQAKTVVPVLKEALNRAKHQSYYYDTEILRAALTALAEIGPEAQEAVADLDSISLDPNPVFARLANEALLKIRK